MNEGQRRLAHGGFRHKDLDESFGGDQQNSERLFENGSPLHEARISATAYAMAPDGAPDQASELRI
jgi:hypothetical protein